MKNDPQLEFAAPTRHGDPDTSRAAAATITGERMTTAMRAVLLALDSCRRPVTDEDIIAQYKTLQMMRQTDQSVRSRRAQLARLGYVEEVGKVLNDAGNQCRTWRIAQKGRDRLMEKHL
jgi:hypothetical protein